LDDYKPFSDVSTSLERIVRFMGEALALRQSRLHKVDGETYEVRDAEGTCKRRFTLNREAATSREDLDLLGLDHPLVQGELEAWRSLPAEELGFSVQGEGEDPVLLSFWLVESVTSNGARRTSVQPIAVKRDGTRLPAVERTGDAHFHSPRPAPPVFTTEERLELFRTVVEPTLQRELKHKGAVSSDGSYAAELVGYIEIAGRLP
jgi:hypothetical protein